MLIGFAACLWVDNQLYSRQWFLRHLGYGTQEGQIVRKIERAERLAAVADVIAFGSSYTRSSLTAEPFLQHGVLPFNFAVVGGGPIYAYYALERIRTVLEHRARKPLLLLELSLNGLDRGYAREPGGGWSEYQHLFGVTRSRFAILRHLVPLLSNFQDSSQLPEFVSTLAWPSLQYRTYANYLGSLSLAGLEEFVSREHSANATFYGAEDMGGFSPSYAVAPVPPPAFDWTPVPLESLVPAKVAFVRMFLDEASRIGAPVILVPRPTVQFGYWVAFENLTRQLEKDYPTVRALRDRDYGLHLVDYDPTGHTNIWGGDHFVQWLIAHVPIEGDTARLQRSISAAFEVIAPPPFSSWEFDRSSATPDSKDALTLDLSPPPHPTILALSPWIDVHPGRQYVLEYTASSSPAPLQVTMGPIGIPDRELVVSTTTPNVPAHLSPTRYFLAMVPATSRIRIRIDNPAAPQASSLRIHLTRLYGHL